MKTISQLIEDLCPEGVEYLTLKEATEMKRGTSATIKDLMEGTYPMVSGGLKPSFYCDKFNRDGETITVAGSGASAGFVKYWKEPIFVCDAFSIKGKEKLNTKFLYYFLKNIQDEIQATKKGSGVPHVHISSIENFEIPLPPLEVQEAIVKVLDKFAVLTTELQAKLQAELQARKLQYDYYRDHLLSFDGQEDIPFKKLGEIGVFYGGLSGKSKEDFIDGNETFISYLNVYSNLSLDIYTQDTVKITKGEKQNTIQYGDILFTGSSETPGECGMTSVLTTKTDKKLYLNSFCFGYRLRDLYLFDPEFLKHLFRGEKMRKQIVKTANGVTRFNVSKKLMEDVLIPIIPLHKQKDIASILDKLDARTTALQKALQTEIDARQKEYEYYRDKLLTFKRK